MDDGAATDSGGAECPEGNDCVMTGAGGMACLAEPNHCVIPCGGAGQMCPESMECQSGACQYDQMNPPAEGHPEYPPPGPDGCPEGTIGPFMFATGFFVCTPPCDGMGINAPCPAPGACLFNPDSANTPC
jgi:hypothetical protein